MVNRLGPPTPRPCASCPYRRDVPQGIWAPAEYEKLPRYDLATPYQPAGVFACHQAEVGNRRMRVCAGWAGCHDGDELLALRVAAFDGTMDLVTIRRVIDYVSPVPLFATGAQAAEHGLTYPGAPDVRAAAAIAKIARVRADLIGLDGLRLAQSG